MKKVIHIMWEDLRSEGMPSFPYAISLLLDKEGYFNKNFLIYDKRDKRKDNLEIPYWKIPFKLITQNSDAIRIVSKLMHPLTPLVILVAKIKGMNVISQPDFAEDLISGKKTLKEFFKKLIIKFNLSLMDKIVLATPYELELLSKIKKIPSKKIVIIPLPSKIKPKKGKPKNYILTVSCWKDKKNLHKMIKVFSKLKKYNKNIKFKIVGVFHKGRYFIHDENRYETGEEYEEKIKKLVDDLKLSKEVSFLGIKKGKELEDLFKNAKLFYLPSKFESFGMVYVEALSSGLPVVAEKNSAIQYIIEDKKTGFLVNSEKEQEEAIKKLISDKSLYNKMSANCLKSAEKYQPENIASQWKKLL